MNKPESRGSNVDARTLPDTIVHRLQERNKRISDVWSFAEPMIKRLSAGTKNPDVSHPERKPGQLVLYQRKFTRVNQCGFLETLLEGCDAPLDAACDCG